MKAINIGNRYEIYDDSLKTYEHLPVQSYAVRFNKMTGFYLEKYHEITVLEDKVYGVHNEKVEKVLSAFSNFERNLGVILSGHKGIGKSLFAKMLSIAAIDKGIPVVVVDKFYPGIATYLEEIDQEVLVLFDEFDKTFGTVSQGENEADPQSTLLGLFDGIPRGKKLFVITCNDLKKLNGFLVNRPGRFHYHFRFEYPSDEEIVTYMKDKLDPQFYDQIQKVVEFSKKVSLNYDCLRAIAFELNSGLAFDKAILDLNIVNVNLGRYNLCLYLSDGSIYRTLNHGLDMFDKTFEYSGYLSKHKDGEVLSEDNVGIRFSVADCVYDIQKMCYLVHGKDIGFDFNYYDLPEDEKIINYLKTEGKNAYLVIERAEERGLHYVC